MEKDSLRIIDPIIPITPKNIKRVVAWLLAAYFFFSELRYLGNADPLKEMTFDDLSIIIFPVRAMFAVIVVPAFFAARLAYKMGYGGSDNLVYVQVNLFYKLIYAMLILMIVADFFGKRLAR